MPLSIRQITKKTAMAMPVVGPYLRAVEGIKTSLAHPVGHFYSPLPDFSEVQANEAAIWKGEKNSTTPGVNLHAQKQIELLSVLGRFHGDQPFSDSKKEGFRYYFDNDFYSYADGIVYYCMLRQLAPKRVIEIGSGFSSSLLLDTNDRHFDSRIQCTFIDPNPERLNSLLWTGDKSRVTVIPQKIQDVDLSIFDCLEGGDILFVDSSHVSKVGSDVNLIFFEILPRLKAGVFIHFHDVFYPFEYPREYLNKRWAWNELYALRAFLSFNSDFEIALFPSYLERFHSEHLRQELPLAWRTPKSWPDIRGASIWIKRTQVSASGGPV